MKNFVILLLSLVIVWGCASTEEVKKDEITPGEIVSAQNEQLSNHPVGGFAYKSSALDTEIWKRWAEAAAPIVKEILTKIPDGYVLQITGHADASGPEEPVGNKPGNIAISSDRAQTVFNALKDAGVDSPKITFKGMGASELLEEYDSRAAEQRRVTFRVMPQE